MRDLSISFIFFSLLSFSLTASSKTILISDIDDTIKRTNVNNRWEAAASVLNTHGRFTGMSEIYTEILRKDPSIRIYYVSGAPELVMEGQHEDFLNHGDFPRGELVLRQDFLDSTLHFKISEITQILNREKPDQLILIGDNGEQDSKVYLTIQSYFPKIKISTFIHVVVSQLEKPVDKSQVSYAYGSELAYHLTTAGYLSPRQSSELIGQINRRISFEDGIGAYIPLPEKSFPSWLDCEGHEFNYSGIAQTNAIQQVVKEHCQ